MIVRLSEGSEEEARIAKVEAMDKIRSFQARETFELVLESMPGIDEIKRK